MGLHDQVQRLKRRASLVLMVLSGFAGLGYQIVWTQQSALWLGHESAAVLAVIAAFFGGLAVGALAAGPRVEKSTRPARWYAGCELLIATWSLVLTLAMAPVSMWMLGITGAHPSPLWQWTVAFCGTFLLLLPATAAMGATLPAMERITAQMRIEGRSIAPLYAANTFGAVIGVLAAAFWLVPDFGLARTAAACAGLNLTCAVAALALFPKMSIATPTPAAHNAPTLWALALTGLLGIGYEVLVVRVLSQVAEDTVYTFAMLLAVYLVGTASGAAAYQRWFARTRDSQLLSALATACVIGTASLWAADSVKSAALAAFCSSMPAAIGAEAILALVAFGLPTLVMGALFSHLAARVSFGRALGVNTVGAAAAPLLFGVLALPALGAKLALLSIPLGYLGLAGWRTRIAWAPAMAVLALAAWAPPLAFIDVPDGGRVVSYQEGVMAAVSVVEDASGVSRLRINNRQQEGSSSTMRVDSRQAWLPLLLHPNPKRALFLGLGTGNTASSAAADPTLQIDAVELLPEVIAASAHFVANPRLHLMAADARRYIRASNQRYDVIVSDNFHPARSGSGSLYTVEHFHAVRERLDGGGIFCQWLPLHQLDLETLRSIVQSFLAVYPHGWGILASNSLETPVLGLVGRAGEARFDVDSLRSRPDIGIEDEFALLGSFVAGPAALKRFAGHAATNTDDRPIVAYRAPRITYAPDTLPRDRLIVLLQSLTLEPDELIAPASDVALPRRLTAYWTARNRFIESGRNVIPSSDVRHMLAQVREPLLSVLHISPDFRPAYDPLVAMATSLAQTDTADASALLTELAQAQPARPEAPLALRAITKVSPELHGLK